MKSKSAPYAEVRAYLENHGWPLMKTWPPYRVHLKPNHLPILVRVNDRKVEADDFERIKRIVTQEQ
jgi:hypothetical protein